MAQVPNRVDMPTAVTHYSNISTPQHHITTSNFMEFNCVGRKMLVPKQSISFRLNGFSRLKPMQVPTYGGAQEHLRAYFVPFRTVMPGFNEFYEDTTYVDNQGQARIPQLHQIRNSTFLKAICNNEFSTFVDYNALPEDERANSYDFVVYDNTTTPAAVGYRKFTTKGKYLYKLLVSLGYKIDFVLNGPTGLDFRHCALQFLCFLKVFYDWYYPSQYADDATSAKIKSLLNYSTYTVIDGASQFDIFLTDQLFIDIINAVYRVCYDSDYFVSAWDNPVAPSNGAYSNISIGDVTAENTSFAVIRNNNIGSPEINANASISQYAIDALKAVNDWMKRKQISGARLLDRYLAQWGITLPAEKLNRSLWIGENISNVRFGDVTSTADTEGATLGAYAGKGYNHSQSDVINFSTDEFGMIIIVASIVPNVGYYQGQDRTTMYSSRFDFYHPEFDALGVQALSTRELYVPTGVLKDADSRGIDWNNAVFGFVPRYAELKVGNEIVSGDIILNSKNAAMEGWSLYRDVSGFYESDTVNSITELVHSKDFVLGTDAEQYNRIFHITDNVEDKFVSEYHFDFQTRFPGKKLYDSYEFREEDKAQKVSMDVNGVRAN